MLSIRSFRNTDPPKLLEIWQQYFLQEAQHVVPVSTSVLQQNVFGLPFFDRQGLFLALEDGCPVGFAHASFGPNRDKSDVNPETGVVNLIMVVPQYPQKMELGRQLLEHCEEYLKAKGAKVIFGGSTRSSASFYTGLYGGCEPVGIYENEEALVSVYESSGYDTLYNTIRFEYDLRNYRTPFTPKSVVWKRKTTINYSDELPTDNWFQSCTTIHFDWFEATAVLKPQGQKLGEVQMRIAQPLEVLGLNIQIPPTAALQNMRIDESASHQGLGTYLLGEALRRLAAELHPSRIETIVMQEEETFVKFLRKFGWKESGHGRVFIKILQDRRTGDRE